jgi:hypothetical protein
LHSAGGGHPHQQQREGERQEQEQQEGQQGKAQAENPQHNSQQEQQQQEVEEEEGMGAHIAEMVDAVIGAGLKGLVNDLLKWDEREVGEDGFSRLLDQGGHKHYYENVKQPLCLEVSIVLELHGGRGCPLETMGKWDIAERIFKSGAGSALVFGTAC